MMPSQSVWEDFAKSLPLCRQTDALRISATPVARLRGCAFLVGDIIFQSSESQRKGF
jgi:hypothetical protein